MAYIETEGSAVRVFYFVIIMCLMAQPAYADNIYTFMQFDCDESSNRLEIKEVRAADYDLKSLDEVPGVIRDLGLAYIGNDHGRTVLKAGQLPKTVASCSLTDPNGEKTEVTLSLMEIHFSRARGMCGAASGPVFNVVLNDTVLARLPSRKDRCFPRYNPLDIARLEYRSGKVGLCRGSNEQWARKPTPKVTWKGELCFYGTPEQIMTDRKENTGLEQELFGSIPSGE